MDSWASRFSEITQHLELSTVLPTHSGTQRLVTMVTRLTVVPPKSHKLRTLAGCPPTFSSLIKSACFLIVETICVLCTPPSKYPALGIQGILETLPRSRPAPSTPQAHILWQWYKIRADKLTCHQHKDAARRRATFQGGPQESEKASMCGRPIAGSHHLSLVRAGRGRRSLVSREQVF